LAKIAGIEMCWSYNRQYGTRYLAAMPTNLYGPGDNYDLANSHVLPALIRKMHEAKVDGRPEVDLWGSGTPRREFLYSEDMADACVHLMSLGGSAAEDVFALGKLLDVGRLNALGWRPKTPLAEGIRLTYGDFLGAKG
jgi:GDP-L-fucose synthase